MAVEAEGHLAANGDGLGTGALYITGQVVAAARQGGGIRRQLRPTVAMTAVVSRCQRRDRQQAQAERHR